MTNADTVRLVWRDIGPDRGRVVYVAKLNLLTAGLVTLAQQC